MKKKHKHADKKTTEAQSWRTESMKGKQKSNQADGNGDAEMDDGMSC